eukprot:Sdes_comp21959_c0_seq1m20499
MMMNILFDFLDIENRTSSQIWWSSLAATAFIGLCPILILVFVPLQTKWEPQDAKGKKKTPTGEQAENHDFLKVLLSFAVGGLLGDIFLHLLPHSGLFGHSHSHSEGAHIHEDAHHHSHDAHASHSHSHPHSHEADHHHHHHPAAHPHSAEGHEAALMVGFWVLCGFVLFLVIEKAMRQLSPSQHHGHSHTCEGSVVGYLNLVADFSHNFTDGLAIGASFLSGHRVGLTTTLAVFLHEIPHEIGDFAILIQSGFSRKSAMAAQVLTAFGALFGTFCALWLEGSEGFSHEWILPFTAGGFLYVAASSILPELCRREENFPAKTIFQDLRETFALLLGVSLMMAIARLEE